MINQTAGWKLISKEQIDNDYLVTVEMTSVAKQNYSEEHHSYLHDSKRNHLHMVQTSSDLLVFDHDPTTEEIEEEITSRGFNPELEYNTNEDRLVRTETEGEEPTVEYSYTLHYDKYMEIFNLIPIALDDMPSSLCLKGDWIHLYYVKIDDYIPTQFFQESFTFLYSTRIHKDTGEIKRKGYNFGLTLSEEETSNLQGFDSLGTAIATGIHLDDPAVTIYHMADKNTAPANVALVDEPYWGTTFLNGEVLRVRKYY